MLDKWWREHSNPHRRDPASVLLLVTAGGPLTGFDYFNYFSATLNQKWLTVSVCVYMYWVGQKGLLGFITSYGKTN